MADIYAAFSEQLIKAQSGEVSLLNEQDGLLVRWGALCEERRQFVSIDLNSEAAELWSLERNTWALVQALYAERLSDHLAPDSPTPHGSTSKNPYTPPLAIVQKLIEANTELIEVSAIRDWLHSIPTSLNPAEIRRGYQAYTKNKLKQARRTGAAVPRGLVDELDPDAVSRGKGVARLDGEDAGYERALIRSLFEYVRAGNLDLAIDMCRQSDQSWRAASLSGGKLWYDPLLSPADDGYGEENDMDQGSDKAKIAKGNLQRREWKKMCRKIAATPGLDLYERALYGAISGDTASVLPVCSTWEDHVWAGLNGLFEANIEAGLATSSEGRYWNRGAKRSVNATTPQPVAGDVLQSLATGHVDISLELQNIFDRLLRNEQGELAAAANHPLRISQTHLIVGNLSELFTAFVELMEQTATETDPETLSHLLRFFAHLALVLRLLNQPLPEYAANRIVEAYISVLEANDQDESLIAFYASHLNSASAVESYARFLLTFGPDTDRNTRQIALQRAHEHGLDLAKIACRTVELVLAEISENPLPEQNTSLLDSDARLNPRQLELIRSLEWLTFDQSTYTDALMQANALARYFLTTDMPHAARELLFQLPTDLLPAATKEHNQTPHIREYLDYSSYFSCLEKHARWSEVWARQPRANAPKLDQIAFKDGVITLINDFYASALEVLESDWLTGGTSMREATQSRRSAELIRIRQILIPHLILRLHSTLFDSSLLIPANLQRALDLANVVADERYKLYMEFVSVRRNTIADYLEQVRTAALRALEGSNAFAV